MQKQTRTLKDRVFLVLKGIGMGAANKVPGVSGGIVAFVAGFYEEFIYSLKKVNGKALSLLFNGRFKSFYDYINGRFLGLLTLGMIFSYFSVSKLLDYLIEHFELYVWAGFFGMIVGSIYYIAKDFNLKSLKNLGFIILGIIGGLAISLLEPAKENDNLWFVFFCGIIGVSGMTLPGLSGSFILMLIGNYVLLLVDSVNALYDTMVQVVSFDFSFIHNSERIRLLEVLASFSVGSVVGLISLSHVLAYVLKRYKDFTYAIIIGFITGSLGVVWPWKQEVYIEQNSGALLRDASGAPITGNYVRFWPNLSDSSTWWGIFFIFVGILIVISLEYYGQKKMKS